MQEKPHTPEFSGPWKNLTGIPRVSREAAGSLPGVVVLLVEPSLGEVEIRAGPAFIQDAGESRGKGKKKTPEKQRGKISGSLARVDKHQVLGEEEKNNPLWERESISFLGIRRGLAGAKEREQKGPKLGERRGAGRRGAASTGRGGGSCQTAWPALLCPQNPATSTT